MAPGRVTGLVLLPFLWPQDIPPLFPWFCPALLSSETLEKGREKEGNGPEVGFRGLGVTQGLLKIRKKGCRIQ